MAKMPQTQAPDMTMSYEIAQANLREVLGLPENHQFTVDEITKINESVKEAYEATSTDIMTGEIYGPREVSVEENGKTRWLEDDTEIEAYWNKTFLKNLSQNLKQLALPGLPENRSSDELVRKLGIAPGEWNPIKSFVSWAASGPSDMEKKFEPVHKVLDGLAANPGLLTEHSGIVPDSPAHAEFDNLSLSSEQKDSVNKIYDVFGFDQNHVASKQELQAMHTILDEALRTDRKNARGQPMLLELARSPEAFYERLDEAVKHYVSATEAKKETPLIKALSDKLTPQQVVQKMGGTQALWDDRKAYTQNSRLLLESLAVVEANTPEAAVQLGNQPREESKPENAQPGTADGTKPVESGASDKTVTAPAATKIEVPQSVQDAMTTIRGAMPLLGITAGTGVDAKGVEEFQKNYKDTMTKLGNLVGIEGDVTADKLEAELEKMATSEQMNSLKNTLKGIVMGVDVGKEKGLELAKSELQKAEYASLPKEFRDNPQKLINFLDNSGEGLHSADIVKAMKTIETAKLSNDMTLLNAALPSEMKKTPPVAPASDSTKVEGTKPEGDKEADKSKDSTAAGGDEHKDKKPAEENEAGKPTKAEVDLAATKVKIALNKFAEGIKKQDTLGLMHFEAPDAKAEGFDDKAQASAYRAVAIIKSQLGIKPANGVFDQSVSDKIKAKLDTEAGQKLLENSGIKKSDADDLLKQLLLLQQAGLYDNEAAAKVDGGMIDMSPMQKMMIKGFIGLLDQFFPGLMEWVNGFVMDLTDGQSLQSMLGLEESDETTEQRQKTPAERAKDNYIDAMKKYPDDPEKARDAVSRTLGLTQHLKIYEGRSKAIADAFNASFDLAQKAKAEGKSVEDQAKIFADNYDKFLSGVNATPELNRANDVVKPSEWKDGPKETKTPDGREISHARYPGIGFVTEIEKDRKDGEVNDNTLTITQDGVTNKLDVYDLFRGYEERNNVVFKDDCRVSGANQFPLVIQDDTGRYYIGGVDQKTKTFSVMALPKGFDPFDKNAQVPETMREFLGQNYNWGYNQFGGPNPTPVINQDFLRYMRTEIECPHHSRYVSDNNPHKNHPGVAQAAPSETQQEFSDAAKQDTALQGKPNTSSKNVVVPASELEKRRAAKAGHDGAADPDCDTPPKYSKDQIVVFHAEESITEIQRQLNLPQTGKWDTKTNLGFTQWLRDQQAANGVKVDGWWGSKTENALIGKIDSKLYNSIELLYRSNPGLKNVQWAVTPDCFKKKGTSGTFDQAAKGGADAPVEKQAPAAAKTEKKTGAPKAEFNNSAKPVIHQPLKSEPRAPVRNLDDMTHHPFTHEMMNTGHLEGIVDLNKVFQFGGRAIGNGGFFENATDVQKWMPGQRLLVKIPQDKVSEFGGEYGVVELKGIDKKTGEPSFKVGVINLELDHVVVGAKDQKLTVADYKNTFDPRYNPQGTLPRRLDDLLAYDDANAAVLKSRQFVHRAHGYDTMLYIDPEAPGQEKGLVVKNAFQAIYGIEAGDRLQLSNAGAAYDANFNKNQMHRQEAFNALKDEGKIDPRTASIEWKDNMHEVTRYSVDPSLPSANSPAPDIAKQVS